MRILFVCTGNTCRSPMAAALMRRALDERGLSEVEVCSAGLYAEDGQPASWKAQAAMMQRGLDLRAHRARLFEGCALDDLVLCMTRRHLQMLQQMGVRRAALIAQEEIPDPYGQGVEAYAACAEALERALRPWVQAVQSALSDPNRL